MKNEGLQKAIKIAGGQTALAEQIGGYPQLVQFWTKTNIPPKWVPLVSKHTGVPREELRPDIYGEIA